jgi:glycosyltransferase involved in cell wall biosynthesis
MEYRGKNHIMHIVQSAEGVHKYLLMFTSNMNRNIYTQTLICSNLYNVGDYESLVDNIQQIEMRRDISFIVDFKAIKKIRQLIKSYKPDIIYCHSSKGGALGRIATIGLKRDFKIVYNPHGWSFNMHCSTITKIIYIFIEQFLATFTDFIIVISNSEKKSALKYRICNKGKLTLIYNGVEIDKIQQTKPLDRINLNISSDAYIIGMVGRISKQKSPDTFIKAAKLIKESIPNAVFIIVGEGNMQYQIEKLAAKYHLSDSLIITGWLEDTIPYIGLFDIAMLLSRWEGFGLALAEYMASKKPIIATNIDAIPELIINNKNGLLVPVDDVIAIYNAVLRLKRNSQLKEKLICEGLQVVKEKFNIIRVIAEHEKLFQKLVNTIDNDNKKQYLQ